MSTAAGSLRDAAGVDARGLVIGTAQLALVDGLAGLDVDHVEPIASRRQGLVGRVLVETSTDDRDEHVDQIGSVVGIHRLGLAVRAAVATDADATDVRGRPAGAEIGEAVAVFVHREREREREADQVAVDGGVVPLPQRRRIAVRPARRSAVVGHAVRQPVGGSVVVGNRRAEVVRHLELVRLRHVERVVADSAFAQGSDHDGAPAAIVGVGRSGVGGVHEDVGGDRAPIDAVLVRRTLSLRLHGRKRRARNEREELVAGPVVELVLEGAAGGGVGAALAEAAGLEGVQHAVVGAGQQHLATEAMAREVAAVARVAGLVIGALGAVAVEIAHPEGHVHRAADHHRVGVEEVAQQVLDGGDRWCHRGSAARVTST